MGSFNDIYVRLGRIADPIVDQSMAAALATASPGAVSRIAGVLVKRGRRVGLAGLVRQYHRLSYDVQALLVHRLDELDGPMRDVAGRHSSRQSAENVIALLRHGMAAGHVYILVELIRHQEDDVRKKAAQCLLDFALRVSCRDRTAEACSWTVGEAQYVDQAVRHAVVHYGGLGRAEILEAFMVLSGRGMGDAAAALSDPRHPAVGPMRHALAAWRGPEMNRCLLTMICLPPLADSVHEALRTAADHGSLGTVVARSHLLHHEPTAKALRRAHGARHLVPGVETIRRWSPSQTRGLPRWLESIGLSPAVQVLRLAAMSQVDDAASRLSTLRRLVTLARGPDDTGADDAIETFCDDQDSRIACIALRYLIRCNWPGLAHLLARLVNCDHPAVRRIAAARLGPIAFDRFWASWPRLNGPKRLATGRALIKIDPHFHRLLGSRLDCGNQPQVLRALSIIHTLNQGGLFEPALVALARDRDAVIVSAAVMALGSADGHDAQTVLDNALDHEDSRVRANAVEALQRRSSARHMPRLTDMAQCDENRPRANAIGALRHLRHPDANAALITMLQDARRMHRVSAMWLVDSMGIVEVAGSVGRLSMCDPDAAVQERAADVVHNLIRLLGGSPSRDESAAEPHAAGSVPATRGSMVQ